MSRLVRASLLAASIASSMITVATAAAAPSWTLAGPGDRVDLVKRSPAGETYLVIRPGSAKGDFLLVSQTRAGRMYQIFIASQRRVMIAESGAIVVLYDGSDLRTPRAAFDLGVADRELRTQLPLAAAASAVHEPTARAAGLPVVIGGLVGIVKGLERCEKLEKTFLLRPIAKACKDFLERKIFKLVAKITGAKVATSLLTCSQALPPKTSPIIHKLAGLLCG